MSIPNLSQALFLDYQTKNPRDFHLRGFGKYTVVTLSST